MSSKAVDRIPCILLVCEYLLQEELTRFADAASGGLRHSFPKVTGVFSVLIIISSHANYKIVGEEETLFGAYVVRYIDVNGRLVMLLELSNRMYEITVGEHCRFTLLTAFLPKHNVPLLGIIYTEKFNHIYPPSFDQLHLWLKEDRYSNVITTLFSPPQKVRRDLFGRRKVQRPEAKAQELSRGGRIETEYAFFDGSHQSAIEIIERLIAMRCSYLKYTTGLVDQSLRLSQVGSLPTWFKMEWVKYVTSNHQLPKQYLLSLEPLVPGLLDAPPERLIAIAKDLHAKTKGRGGVFRHDKTNDWQALQYAATVAAKMYRVLAAQPAAPLTVAELRLLLYKPAKPREEEVPFTLSPLLSQAVDSVGLLSNCAIEKDSMKPPPYTKASSEEVQGNMDNDKWHDCSERLD